MEISNEQQVQNRCNQQNRQNGFHALEQHLCSNARTKECQKEKGNSKHHRIKMTAHKQHCDIQQSDNDFKARV